MSVSLPINESMLKKSLAVLIGIMVQADQRGPAEAGLRGCC